MTGSKIEIQMINKIALVTMNRTEKKNAFDASMFSALEYHLLFPPQFS